MSDQNATAAARHIKGATIAWGAGNYYDFDNPNPEVIGDEDVAFALGSTVRWRGQTRYATGLRVFYWVAEHCVYGARQMLEDGHGAVNARAFLWHEDDEIVLPDMPGPVKPLLPGFKPLAKRQGDAIGARFKVETPDPDLVKRYDIRALATERRDLLNWAIEDAWSNVGGGQTSMAGYEPFDEIVRPVGSPYIAAHEWLILERHLRAELGVQI